MSNNWGLVNSSICPVERNTNAMFTVSSGCAQHVNVCELYTQKGPRGRQRGAGGGGPDDGFLSL